LCVFFLQNGGGAAAPNPARKLEAHFLIIFVWGEWLRLHTPTFAGLRVFFPIFLSRKRGRASAQTLTEAPCPPTLGDTKGARRGKREKGGGAAAPNLPKTAVFFFCSFLFVLFQGRVYMYALPPSPTKLPFGLKGNPHQTHVWH
jgi:hypothetical protein